MAYRCDYETNTYPYVYIWKMQKSKGMAKVTHNSTTLS